MAPDLSSSSITMATRESGDDRRRRKTGHWQRYPAKKHTTVIKLQREARDQLDLSRTIWERTTINQGIGSVPLHPETTKHRDLCIGLRKKANERSSV